MKSISIWAGDYSRYEECLTGFARRDDMKGKILVVTLVASLGLTGCGTSMPNLSRLNNDIEAEYMAGELLKNDTEYKSAFVYDHSALEATPSPSPTAVPVGSNAPTEAPVSRSPKPNSTHQSSSGASISEGDSYVDLDTVIDIPGIHIKQMNYALKQSYGSKYAPVTASSGKKLLVVRFRIKNTSSQEIKVNMEKLGLKYSLMLGNDVIGGPLLSIVPKDMQYYHGTVSSGKSHQVVLLFEVDASKKIKKAAVVVSNGTQSAKLNLK